MAVEWNSASNTDENTKFCWFVSATCDSPMYIEIKIILSGILVASHVLHMCSSTHITMCFDRRSALSMKAIQCLQLTYNEFWC